MQSTGPRPPIIHHRAGRAAMRWAVVIWSLVFYLSALATSGPPGLPRAAMANHRGVAGAELGTE